MKARVLYISKSGKSATLAVDTAFGPIVQSVSGFVSLPEGHDVKVGDELTIPATSVAVEHRTSKETGEMFSWLIFS